jgi:transcriptional regulator of acetoin/glycerol metabolism
VLARHFLELAAPGRGWQLDARFVERLLLHRWPMNIRELRNVMQQLGVASPSGVLKVDDLQPLLRRPAPGTVDTDELPDAVGRRRYRRELPERGELEVLLTQHRGSVADVAAHYGRDRKQVYRWLQRYGLDPERFR